MANKTIKNNKNPSIVGAPSLCGTGGASSRPLAISGRHGSSLPLLRSPSQVLLLFVQCQHYIGHPLWDLKIHLSQRSWWWRSEQASLLIWLTCRKKILKLRSQNPTLTWMANFWSHLLRRGSRRLQTSYLGWDFEHILLDLLQRTPFQVARSHLIQAANYQDPTPIPWESLASLWHCLL